MSVVSTRLAGLVTTERDELLGILSDARGSSAPTPRYQSDAGDAAAWPLLLLLSSLGGLIAYVIVFGNPIAGITEYWQWAFYALPRTLVSNPAALGLQVAIGAAIWSTHKLITMRGRHGWALASFGFVRIRGGKVQFVRYPDIASVAIHRGTIGKERRRYTHYKLTARDGSSMGSYAAALLDGLRSQLPADAKVSE